MQSIDLSLFSETDDDWINQTSALIDDISVAATACEVVPGLCYLPNYIDRTEEQKLLSAVDSGEWSMHWSRRTQHYGRSYLESTKPKLHLEEEARLPEMELPAWIWPICNRLLDDNIFGRPANQMGINEYTPGQGIAGHVDYHGGEVVSITLGTGCVMDFERLDSTEKASMWLAPRSMVALKAEARSLWTHGIARRKTDIVNGISVARGRRVSVTLRCIVY